MEIAIALLVLFFLVKIFGGRSSRANESYAERQRRQGLGMAVMDHYDVGPFRKR